MKLNDILSRIPLWFESGNSFVLSSPPGRGKTDTIFQAPELIKKATGQNIGLSYLNGGLLTPMHLLGYGLQKHTPTHSVMVFSKPFFWTTDKTSVDEGGKFLEEYDGIIIFVDEADKADIDVKKILGDGAHSKRFGPHMLPKNSVVWMAMNRAEDRSGSTKELDHLINRRTEIPVTDDVDSWVKWATKNNVMPVTIAFAANNPHVVWADKLPEKQGPYCTPRSLVKQDKFMQLLTSKGIPMDDGLALEESTGTIGGAATAQYFATIKLDSEMPKYEEIKANPKTARVPSNDKPDACMLICYNLAHRVTAEDAAPVITYIDRLPKEFAATFARAAVVRNYKLAMVPAFHKWAMANAHLMNAINNA